MFHHCTGVLVSESNRYIQTKLNSKENFVSFTKEGNSLVKSKSSAAIELRLVDIVSVELSSNPNEYVPQGNGFVVRKMPAAFCLHCLFSVAHAGSDLLEGLEILSYIAAFFQQKPHFDAKNTPVLQEYGMENFSAELVKMSAADKALLWQSLHIPYSPSLLYKVGLLFVGDAGSREMSSKAPFVSAFGKFQK